MFNTQWLVAQYIVKRKRNTKFTSIPQLARKIKPKGANFGVVVDQIEIMFSELHCLGLGDLRTVSGELRFYWITPIKKFGRVLGQAFTVSE